MGVSICVPVASCVWESLEHSPCHREAPPSWLKEELTLHDNFWPRIGDSILINIYRFKLKVDGAKHWLQFREVQNYCYTVLDESTLVTRQHQSWPLFVDESLQAGIPRSHWRQARASGRGHPAVWGH